MYEADRRYNQSDMADIGASLIGSTRQRREQSTTKQMHIGNGLTKGLQIYEPQLVLVKCNENLCMT